MPEYDSVSTLEKEIIRCLKEHRRLELKIKYDTIMLNALKDELKGLQIEYKAKTQ